jgi:hypothetical protein
MTAMLRLQGHGVMAPSPLLVDLLAALAIVVDPAPREGPTGDPVAELRDELAEEVFQHPTLIGLAMGRGQAYTIRRAA